MWLIILALVLSLAILSVVYLCSRFGRLSIIRDFSSESKLKRRCLSFAVFACMGLILYLCMGVTNTIICILHLTMFWLICDLANIIIGKIKGKAETATDTGRYNLVGFIAVSLTVVYLLTGYYFAVHVYETNYIIGSEKVEEDAPIRIAMFSDSHVGAVFDGDKLQEYCDTISCANPDVLVIVGDFIDDGTTKEDMIKSCRAVGSVKTKYGTYYVFGNHDKGYFASSRGYSGDDLKAELKKNGVIILEDESVLVDDRFYIIGRQDAGEKEINALTSRMDMPSLVSNLDKDKYMIVLDHQPTDYDNEAAAGVDLVLSGHTHGGQMLPVTKVGEWAGINDRTYGHEKRGNTEFIVSSGIGDWEILFKTGCISEYVVVDITKNTSN